MTVSQYQHDRMLVTYLSIWHDCPFASLVPASIEIRRGRVPGFKDEMLVFWHPKANRHVDIQMTWPEVENTDMDLMTARIKPAIRDLGA